MPAKLSKPETMLNRTDITRAQQRITPLALLFALLVGFSVSQNLHAEFTPSEDRIVELQKPSQRIQLGSYAYTAEIPVEIADEVVALDSRFYFENHVEIGRQLNDSELASNMQRPQFVDHLQWRENDQNEIILDSESRMIWIAVDLVNTSDVVQHYLIEPLRIQSIAWVVFKTKRAYPTK